MISASSTIRVEGTGISPWHPRLDAFKLMHGCKGMYQAGTSSGCLVKQKQLWIAFVTRGKVTICIMRLGAYKSDDFYPILSSHAQHKMTGVYKVTPSKPSFSRPFSLNHGTMMKLGSLVAHGRLTCIKSEEILTWHCLVIHCLVMDDLCYSLDANELFQPERTLLVYTLDKLTIWPYWCIPLPFAIVDSLPTCKCRIVLWSSRPNKIIWMIHILMFDARYRYLSNIQWLMSFSFRFTIVLRSEQKTVDVEMRL